jgi:hypothetical protein
MDTTTLAVGQDVYMISGPYGNKGKVVKITPWGIEVRTVGRELFRFNHEGKACDSEGKVHSDTFSWAWATWEGGLWELTDTRFPFPSTFEELTVH